ncbi:hypothetical protein SUGI_0848270 [Cryptomeria japonica]|uniref:transcription factor ABA-INDUCIBLE bHLH-TYPE n=1 Tax=Cryptomeria japonica TaxID=3369 RepID=UPI00241497D8|nr:transcription factor ABA-INDUCIBLE bHLH-TYPE [Cryptomeria japonica]GLJ40978.1 hypothetical protein SUGI_0848270 [Cryptomeria japonica]
MLTYRGPEDLYTVLSAHYPVVSSKPIEKEQFEQRPIEEKQFEQQSISRKRSWDDVISPSLPMGLQDSVSEKNMCSRGELHVFKERSRRKKMSCMFNNLSSLLPALHKKVDKISIINETVNYIKTLQGTLKDLQERNSEMEALLKKSSLSKLEDSPQVCDAQVPESALGVPSPSFKILGSSVVGTHAFTSIWGSQQSGFLPRLFSILDANQLEMIDCTMNADGCNMLYTLHVMSKSNSEQPIIKAFTCVINSITTSHQK